MKQLAVEPPSSCFSALQHRHALASCWRSRGVGILSPLLVLAYKTRCRPPLLLVLSSSSPTATTAGQKFELLATPLSLPSLLAVPPRPCASPEPHLVDYLRRNRPRPSLLPRTGQSAAVETSRAVSPIQSSSHRTNPYHSFASASWCSSTRRFDLYSLRLTGTRSRRYVHTAELPCAVVLPLRYGKLPEPPYHPFLANRVLQRQERRRVAVASMAEPP